MVPERMARGRPPALPADDKYLPRVGPFCGDSAKIRRDAASGAGNGVSSMNGKKTERPQFLSGWKEIANYLGKGVRTVQRYERELGLPVRRPAAKPWGSVVATKVEVDAWVSASPIREAFRLIRPVPDPPISTVAALQSGMERMGKLRHNMEALRDEVRASVRLLRTSVRDLQGQLNQHQRPANPAPKTVKRGTRT